MCNFRQLDYVIEISGIDSRKPQETAGGLLLSACILYVVFRSISYGQVSQESSQPCGYGNKGP